MIGVNWAVLDLEFGEFEWPNLCGVRQGTKFYLVGKIRNFVFLFKGAYRPPLEIDYLQIQFWLDFCTSHTISQRQFFDEKIFSLTKILDFALSRPNMAYNGAVHKGTDQTVSASVLEPSHWIGNSTISSWNTSFPVVCDNRKYLNYAYRHTRKMPYNGLVHKGTGQTVSASVLEPWHWIGNSTILSWNTSFPVVCDNRK
jgi:hypothetical protein